MAHDSAMPKIDVYHTQPSAALFDIEHKAHAYPWSEVVFFQPSGPGTLWWAVSVDDRIAGFANTQLIADEVTLHNIAIDPSYQGQGLGQHLLQHILNYVDEHQALMFLEVRESNATAIHVYQRAGFSLVGRRPHYYASDSGREDALVMRRESK
ncbi:[SSU ribosomal protein S18P]-alanine acetyltransferase [Idiomarina fontislapidosi]|nr:[SSU ribosomal protein S18P]-alanine acetyltransferase [Idiomarina fontislapidosi]